MNLCTRTVLAVLIFAIVAPAVHAERQNVVEQPWPEAWWLVEGDYWYTRVTSSGTWTQCAYANGCWTCLRNRYGKVVCSYGLQTGSCNCEDQQREGAAAGITDCVLLAGSCSTRTTS
jgi:hypothetical protein